MMELYISKLGGISLCRESSMMEERGNRYWTPYMMSLDIGEEREPIKELYNDTGG